MGSKARRRRRGVFAQRRPGSGARRQARRLRITSSNDDITEPLKRTSQKGIVAAPSSADDSRRAGEGTAPYCQCSTQSAKEVGGGELGRAQWQSTRCEQTIESLFDHAGRAGSVFDVISAGPDRVSRGGGGPVRGLAAGELHVRHWKVAG